MCMHMLWQAYYSGVPPAPPAALIRLEGVLMVATMALLVTVGGWLLFHLMRCSVHRCRGVRASWRTKKKLLCAPVKPLQRVGPSSAKAHMVAADDLDIRHVRSDPHAPLKKGHRRSHSAPVTRSLAMLLHSKGEEEEGAKAEAGRWTSDTGRVTTRASWRTMIQQCAQQLSTPPSPSPRKPSMLERAAGPLLRRAGSLCVLVLALVLVPTALQLRHVLQQDDGIIDTDIASFRSVTGRYTDRQDAFWLLLIDSNTTLLHDLAHASSAACIGVRGEASTARRRQQGSPRSAAGRVPRRGCGWRH